MSLVLLWMILSDDVYHLFVALDPSLQGVDLGHLFIDLSACAAMIVIALRANRMYTLWLAGLQILAFLAHLARELVETISPIAYAILYMGPFYFQIIILAFGIWLHHRRVTLHGNYRQWRSSSPPSQANARAN